MFLRITVDVPVFSMSMFLTTWGGLMFLLVWMHSMFLQPWLWCSWLSLTWCLSRVPDHEHLSLYDRNIVAHHTKPHKNSLPFPLVPRMSSMAVPLFAGMLPSLEVTLRTFPDSLTRGTFLMSLMEHYNLSRHSTSDVPRSDSLLCVLVSVTKSPYFRDMAWSRNGLS